MHKKLPKIYHYIDEFNYNYIKALHKDIALIFRNYDKKIDQNLIKKIKLFCDKNNRKLFISNNLNIAIKHNLNGIYIPSFNRNLKINRSNLKKNFIILSSAHNIKEIREKEKQNVDVIFLSPLFKVKKYKNYLNLNKFNFLSKFTKKKIVALGGISEKNVNKLSLTNCNGFASISFIKVLNKKCIVSYLLKAK